LLQLEFFDHFLKGEDNGWDRRPQVLLNIRHVDHFEARTATEWPLPETSWTGLHLHTDRTLSPGPALADWSVSFPAMGEGLTLVTDPFEEEVEITGPSSARLWVSSSTEDADLFLILRLFEPDGSEVVFQGALDPYSPLAHGWLRASHRELDLDLTTEWRPVHRHSRREPLVPEEVYALDIEIWPTSIVIPTGYRLGLSIQGRDYEYEGPRQSGSISTFKNPFTGVGPFLHDDPADRPAALFDGTTTIHGGPSRPSSILLPFIGEVPWG
jgi:hypothetical protein